MEELFVSCPHHFEELLQDELRSFGISKTRISFCGVHIPKSIENVYTVNYRSRVATRVLWPLSRFGCPNREALYAMVRRVKWELFLTTDKTFAIDANVHHHPEIKNSHFAALVVKDALCDHFRDKTGARPSVNIQTPDVQLNLFIQQGFAHLYLDTSGAPLHKRGWRLENSEATLHESLAAGLLLLSGYTKDKIFCDPFCGSGTFVVEAALIATNTPPGYFRTKWGFSSLPEHDENKWLSFKQKIDSKIIPLEKGKIFASDKDTEAYKMCYRHLKHTSLRGLVEIENQDVATYTPSVSPNFVICNPPYGKRLELLKSAYENLGLFLKNRCDKEVEAFVLTSDQKLVELLPQKIKRSFAFKSGGLDVALYNIG